MTCSCDSNRFLLTLTPEGKYLNKCCRCQRVELLTYQRRKIDKPQEEKEKDYE